MIDVQFWSPKINKAELYTSLKHLANFKVNKGKAN